MNLSAFRQQFNDSRASRSAIDACFRRAPELYPKGFAEGDRLKEGRVSARREILIGRIILNDGTADLIKPSSLMPDIFGRVGVDEGPSSPRQLSVPFRATARGFRRADRLVREFLTATGEVLW